jgi:hypothetical protein
MDVEPMSNQMQIQNNIQNQVSNFNLQISGFNQMNLEIIPHNNEEEIINNDDTNNNLNK